MKQDLAVPIKPDMMTVLDYEISRQKGAFSQLGHRYRTAAELEAAVKRSKFTKILASMNDEQVKILTFALIYDDKVVEAVKCYQTANCHEAQLHALKREILSREITLNK